MAIELGADPRLVQAAWDGQLSAPDLLWQQLATFAQRWLLIIDEADDPMPLALPHGLPCDGTGWLREAGHGATIVTSRDGNPDVWAGADILTIRELSSDQATDVLLDAITPTGQPDPALTAVAAELAETLGGLPLALHLAGSFMQARLRRQVRRSAGRTTSLNTLAAAAVNDCLQGVRRNVGMLDQDDSFAGRLRQGRTGKIRVMAIWESSLELLEHRGIPAARALLEILSCFDAVPVPLVVLNAETLSEFPDFGLGFDEDQRDTVLEALNDMALVEERSVALSGEPVLCIHVHRLVLETVAAKSAEDEDHRRQIWATAAAVLAGAANGDPDDPATWRRWTLLAPHCMAITQRCPNLPEAVATILPFAQPALRYLRLQGSYREALAMAERLLELCRAVFGVEDPRTLSCRHDWAAVLQRAGRSVEATSEYKAVWQARARVLGPDHIDTLKSRSEYAERIVHTGKLAEAERENAAVLAARRRTLGAEDPDTLVSRSQLAMTVRRMGRWSEAAAEHRSILAERMRVLGRDHPKTLTSRNNLAFTLYIMGDWNEAETLHRENLEARQRVLGLDYPATLDTKANLALVLHGLGRLVEAEALIREALAVRTRVFGP